MAKLYGARVVVVDLRTDHWNRLSLGFKAFRYFVLGFFILSLLSRIVGIRPVETTWPPLTTNQNYWCLKSWNEFHFGKSWIVMLKTMFSYLSVRLCCIPDHDLLLSQTSLKVQGVRPIKLDHFGALKILYEKFIWRLFIHLITLF